MNEGRHHDMGGLEAGLVVREDHDKAPWEKRVDALMVLLGKNKLLFVDELRRGIEELGADAYDRYSYYERWMASMTNILLEKKIHRGQRARRTHGGDRGRYPARVAMNGPDAGYSFPLFSAVAVPCRRPAEGVRMPLAGPMDGLNIVSAGARSARLDGTRNRAGTDGSGNGGDVESATGEGPGMQARFAPGDRVRVLRRFPPGHVRTPWYCRGKYGEVERICGRFAIPSNSHTETRTRSTWCCIGSASRAECSGRTTTGANGIASRSRSTNTGSRRNRETRNERA